MIERRTDGKRVRYERTPAGEELRPVVEALGAWGIRWIPELGTLTRIRRGDCGWGDALRAGALGLAGPEHMRRGPPQWLALSDFAAVPRPV